MLTLTDIAAPSFVRPATVADNAAFLAGRVAEVGLCFFEAQACLAYTEVDLPPALAELPLRWHVHLPVDLPWSAGGAAASALAARVLGRAAFLHPRFAVLHAPDAPPAEQCALLRAFAGAWSGACPVLLENIQQCNFANLSGEVYEKYAFCLDIGHLIAFGQEDILEREEVLCRVRLVHWSAPGDGDRHLPLTALTAEQRTLACRAARRLPPDVQHMVEVFSWNGIEDSVPVLAQLLEE